MDQLILQWISNQETGRHNRAQERETARHNAAQEFLERANQLNQATIAALNRNANMVNAQVAASATRYASDNARRATEYAARTSADASRYATRTNAWSNLINDATRRQANLIQDRYNRGQLAIATSRADEEKRANKAREFEASRSRIETREMRMLELEHSRDRFAYEKERDWLQRAKSEREFETNMRLQMSRQVVDLLGVAAKARMFSQMKGDKDYGQTTSTLGKKKEPEGQEIWDSINRALAAEGR